MITLLCIVTHMTPVKQRLGKHVPEVTLSATKNPEAGII
jgi:hypothetical protein